MGHKVINLLTYSSYQNYNMDWNNWRRADIIRYSNDSLFLLLFWDF